MARLTIRSSRSSPSPPPPPSTTRRTTRSGTPFPRRALTPSSPSSPSSLCSPSSSLAGSHFVSPTPTRTPQPSGIASGSATTSTSASGSTSVIALPQTPLPAASTITVPCPDCGDDRTPPRCTRRDCSHVALGSPLAPSFSSTASGSASTSGRKNSALRMFTVPDSDNSDSDSDGEGEIAPPEQAVGDRLSTTPEGNEEEMASQERDSTTPTPTPAPAPIPVPFPLPSHIPTHHTHLHAPRQPGFKKERIWSKLSRTCANFITSIPTPTLLDTFSTFIGGPSGRGGRGGHIRRGDGRIIINNETITKMNTILNSGTGVNTSGGNGSTNGTNGTSTSISAKAASSSGSSSGAASGSGSNRDPPPPPPGRRQIHIPSLAAVEGKETEVDVEGEDVEEESEDVEEEVGEGELGDDDCEEEGSSSELASNNDDKEGDEEGGDTDTESEDEGNDEDEDNEDNATTPHKTSNYIAPPFPPSSHRRTITSLHLDKLVPSDPAILQSRSLIHIPKKKMTLLFHPVPSQPHYWDSLLSRPPRPPPPCHNSISAERMKALVTGPPPGKSWIRRPLKRTYGMYDITSKEEMGWIRWVEEKEVVKGEMRRRVELIRRMKEDEERRGVKRVLTKRRVWTGKVIYSDDGATTATTTSSMGKENEGHNKKEKGKQVETGAKANEDEDDTNEVYPPNRTSLAVEQVPEHQEEEVENEEGGVVGEEAYTTSEGSDSEEKEEEEGSDDTVRPRAVDTTLNEQEEGIDDDTDTEETVEVAGTSATATTTPTLPAPEAPSPAYSLRPRRTLKRRRGPEEEDEVTPAAGPSNEADRRPLRSRRRL